MKEVAIMSGKGGTGKTTIAAAFASLAENAVLADCDVDAADLHLILEPSIRERIPFHGMELAVKDEGLCNDCGECGKHCRFGAIDAFNAILPERCEGCAVCELVCPKGAISMVERVSGTAYLSETRFGPMAHGELGAAEEASGKLVTLVRSLARKIAAERSSQLILIDGPPGIGCPAIATLTGVDLVLAITEPTVSGVHDLGRVLDIAEHFKTKVAVCVNKYDINPGMTMRIHEYAAKRGIEVLGKIPYDIAATSAMVEGKTVIEHSDGPLSAELRRLWSRTESVIATSGRSPIHLSFPPETSGVGIK